jgi:hypothetical protein
MKRQNVPSSNLRSIGYDAKEHILEVEFVRGAVYQYFDVPPSEYQALMNADSHGRYFNANIRDDYDYLPIR